MWGRLGAGYNVGDALMFTLCEQTYFSSPNCPANTFRFKGQWIDTIRLVGN